LADWWLNHGIGAIFGALNTMYSAVAERGREIATMRAVGWRRLGDLFLSSWKRCLFPSFGEFSGASLSFP